MNVEEFIRLLDLCADETEVLVKIAGYAEPVKVEGIERTIKTTLKGNVESFVITTVEHRSSNTGFWDRYKGRENASY